MPDCNSQKSLVGGRIWLASKEYDEVIFKVDPGSSLRASVPVVSPPTDVRKNAHIHHLSDLRFDSQPNTAEHMLDGRERLGLNSSRERTSHGVSTGQVRCTRGSVALHLAQAQTSIRGDLEPTPVSRSHSVMAS